MKDILCYSVDAESAEGEVLARKFKVKSFPTLIFLEHNGRIRDLIQGFLPAEPFAEEVRRIKKNEFTLSSLEEEIERSPLDLEARWRLAQKLGSLGDKEGYERQISFIRKNDPEGRSIGSRSLRFQDLKQEALESMELQKIYDFLKTEKNSDLLLDGWYFLFKVESFLADNHEIVENRAEHRRLQVSAARALWSHVPPTLNLRVANEIVAVFTSLESDALSHDHKRLMLEVGKAAAESAPEDPAALSLYGQCLFSAGRKKDAVEQLRRCIEIDPKNARWRDQLVKFEER